MFSSSQFDVTGGGFTSSQFTQSTDSTPSPAKSRDNQALIPVTVKQLSEALQSGDDKAKFTIDGTDVANVALVGMVYKKSVRVTDVGFVLDDGTGQIECKRWVNETHDTKEMEEIEEGMYARVIGHLKSFQGAKHLAAFSVRPVTNFDEITFHFINCIHFHLKKSKSQVQGDGPTPQMVNSSQSTPVRNGTSSTIYQTTPPNQFSTQMSGDALKGYDQMIIDYLQQPANYDREKGVHRDEISHHLKIPLDKIAESIRTLEEEGLIYSTVDEFHFKSTASGS